MTCPFAKDDELRADFFDDLEYVRAEKDGFAFPAERLDKAFQNERRSDVEAGEWLVEDEDVGIVHERGDHQDPLAHALRVAADGDVAVRMQ